MNRIKVWPHITLMAVAVALIALVAVVKWLPESSDNDLSAEVANLDRQADMTARAVRSA